MDFLKYIIMPVAELIGNFGWTVVLSVAVCFAITIPFKHMAAKSKEAKNAAAPDITKIREKYHANAMGVAHEDWPGMDPSIKAMTYDQRDEAMANEISATYKKYGYKMWTGWIPGFLTIAFVILLYSGIGQSITDDFYRVNFAAVKENFAENAFHAYTLIAMLASTVISQLYTLIKGVVSCKVQKLPMKPVLLAWAVSAALSIGLNVWIATSVNTAMAIAILTFHIISFGETIIKDIIAKCNKK